MSWKNSGLVALNPLEARGAVAMFCGAISKGIDLDAFWVPADVTIVFRAVQREGVKRKKFQPPPAGILIGRYSREATATAFVEDLDALLSMLMQEKAA